jgi:hypothetical protein
MITSEVATSIFNGLGWLPFLGFLPSTKLEKSPMNMNLQELLQRFENTERDGEKLQHVLIGSPEGIHEATHTLHALRYADVRFWSPIVPVPNSSLSMSVLTKYRST